MSNQVSGWTADAIQTVSFFIAVVFVAGIVTTGILIDNHMDSEIMKEATKNGCDVIIPKGGGSAIQYHCPADMTVKENDTKVSK